MGGRIDYTLVDRPFYESFVSVCTSIGDGLDTGTRDDLDPLSREAALSACTLNNHFQPAPFGGGGMSDAPQWCYDHHFRSPSTGMVYTPPQYSDHIAVSLLIHSNAIAFECVTDRKFDSGTRKCQPHTSMKSIKSYFQQPNSSKQSLQSQSSIQPISLQPSLKSQLSLESQSSLQSTSSLKSQPSLQSQPSLKPQTSDGSQPRSSQVSKHQSSQSHQPPNVTKTKSTNTTKKRKQTNEQPPAKKSTDRKSVV